MRQTLFRIPIDGPWFHGTWAEVPGFGWGLVLFLWAAWGAYSLYRNRKQLSLKPDTLMGIGIWLVGAYVIVTLPNWFHRTQNQQIEQITTAINNKSAPAVPLHINRGQAYVDKGDYKLAIDDFTAAIEASPQHAVGYRRRALLLASCANESIRDGKQAEADARKVLDRPASYEDEIAGHDLLAAALADQGQFEQAIANGQTAASLSEKHFNSISDNARMELANIRQRLQLYKNDKPFRQPAYHSSIPIRGYGFMMFLGFTFGIVLAVRRAATVEISSDTIMDLGMWFFVAGVGGARLFHVVQFREDVFHNKKGIDMLWAALNIPDGGLVLFGGVLMVIAVFFVFCRLRKLQPLLMLDIVTPSFFIGLMFGRLGCFMNGCCYGDRCTLPWAVEFPLGSVPDFNLVKEGFIAADAVNSMPLHPTQIYSSMNALILFTLTAIYFKTRPRPGSVAALGLMIYPITRFLIEFIRGDELGQFNTSLTISQWVSIGLFLFGVVLAAKVLPDWNRKPVAVKPTT